MSESVSRAGVSSTMPLTRESDNGMRFLLVTDVVSLNTVLEYVEKLDIEDQQELLEIIRHRLIEKKHSGIVQRAKQAKAGVKNKQCRSGTAEDLLADLNG